MIPKYDLQILQIAFKRCFGAKKLIPPPKVAESPRKCRCTNKQTRWWFQIFFIFFPYLGKISNLTNVFQLDWKPPTSKQTNKPTNQPTKTRINTHRRWCPFFLPRCYFSAPAFVAAPQIANSEAEQMSRERMAIFPTKWGFPKMVVPPNHRF